MSDEELRVGSVAIDGMSDEELKAFADSGDNGYAQMTYAYTRLLGLGTLDQDQRAAAMEEVTARARSGDDELFETAGRYLVEAMRNQNRIAASQLAGIYDHFDRIEARAWLLIDREAGGDALSRRESRAAMGLIDEPYTDYEKEQSEIRAAKLIADHGLASDLHPPAACFLPQ